MHNNRKAYMYGGLAIFFWSTVATAFKIALQDLEVSTLLFYSSFSSMSIITIIMLIKNQAFDFISQSSSDIRKSIIMASINPFAYYLILFKAYELLPAQEAQPLNYTWPLMLTLLSVVFLGEKIQQKRIIGILISFFGILVISTKGDLLSFQFTNLFGSILAISSSILWAAYWIINNKDERLELVKMSTNFFIGTFLIFIYIMINGNLYIPSFKSLLACIYIGFFEMGITFVLWSKGLSLIDKKEKLVRYSYLGPFISLVFISLIIKEEILISTIIGLILIIFGIVL